MQSSFLSGSADPTPWNILKNIISSKCLKITEALDWPRAVLGYLQGSYELLREVKSPLNSSLKFFIQFLVSTAVSLFLLLMPNSDSRELLA